MTTPWHVHVAPEAAAVLRTLSRSAAARVARALDTIAADGTAGLAVDRAVDRWTARVHAGEYLLTIAGRDGDRRILVVNVALIDAHPVQHAVDVLPVTLSRRRIITRALQGLDLDLKYTVRSLRRAPMFAAIVMATLAVGFGGATALLDTVNTVYGASLPFGDADRLVRIRNANTSPSGETRRYNLTPNDVDIIRRGGHSFSDVVAQAGRNLSLVGDGPAERVSAIGVSAQWAQALRLTPALGRVFSAAEERAGTDAGVALISYALWQRRFGGDSSVLGRSLRYDGGAVTIVGVMPRFINYPYDADVWTPWTFVSTNTTASTLNVVARLRDDASLMSARTDANRAQVERAAAGSHPSATAFDIAPLRTDFIREEGRTVQALAAAVLFLLVLACVNVANLLVARFTTRRAELGLRAALGGSRDQQVRQMLLEALILFSGGIAGGVLLARSVRGALSITVPDVLRTQLGLGDRGLGIGVAGLAAGAGLICAIVVGTVAAFRAARTDPMSLIRHGGRGSVGLKDRRVFDVLVATQLSFSLVLLVGASLLIGHFRSLSATDQGFDIDDVSTMRVTLDQDRYRAADARLQLVRSIEERLGAVPGVERVGITTVNPICCGDWGASIEVEGQPILANRAPTLVAHSYVTPGYFEAMRIPVLRGQAYERSDQPGGVMTVIIDEPFARMAWPGQDPLGKRVRSARPGQPWRTVVGVVPVSNHIAEMRASWFLPYYQDPTGSSTEQLHIMVRGARGLSTTVLRHVVAQIDPALAVYGETTMRALQRERMSQDRLGAIVSAAFAAFGLLLAGFSLYGLLSYSVELRTAEMGVRMALGASRASIVRMILAQAGVRLATGTVLGLLLATGLNHVLRGVIDGLPWIPWQSVAVLTVLMVIITVAAAALPAMRATRIDPARALRG